MKKYLKQIEFTKNKFRDLKDGSGTLIFDHALRVATFLFHFLKPFKLGKRENEILVLAGLFHDLLEDTDTTEDEILKLSNQKTLKLVKEMTISFEKKTIKEAVKPLFSTSDELAIIKFADIYDNTKKTSFVIRINGMKWYRNFYMPLLKEYIKLVKFKLKIVKKHRKIVKSLADIVLKEIEILGNNLDSFSKLIS